MIKVSLLLILLLCVSRQATDCTQSLNELCVNSSLPECADFVYDIKQKLCIDCSIGSGFKCINLYVNGCDDYKFDESTTQCYNCNLATADGNCVNKSYDPCKYFYYDSNAKECVDCSTAENKQCVNVNIPGCQNYSYSCNDIACYDCVIPVIESESCLNDNIDYCSTFTYDASQQICVDCSLAANKQCVYQKLDGCSNYNYYEDTDSCVDCSTSAPERSLCVYEGVANCPPHFFDFGSFTCIMCDYQSFWTDTKCNACFKDENRVQANSLQTGCQYPDNSYHSVFTDQNLYTFSGQLQIQLAFLLLSILLV